MFNMTIQTETVPSQNRVPEADVPSLVIDRVLIREQISDLETSGKLAEFSRAVITRISQETNLFEDIFSIGFKLNTNHFPFSLQRLAKGDLLNNAAFVGPKISYSDRKLAAYEGKTGRSSAHIRAEPCKFEDILHTLVLGGIFPEPLKAAIHEATHLYQLQRENETITGIGKLPTLANTTLNEALARRAADIPCHEKLSPSDTEHYIRDELASLPPSAYRYFTENTNIEDRCVEWNRAFRIIDTLISFGYPIGIIAQWIVRNKAEYNKIRKDNPHMDELDYHEMKLLEFAREHKYENVSSVLEIREKQETDPTTQFIPQKRRELERARQIIVEELQKLT